MEVTTRARHFGCGGNASHDARESRLQLLCRQSVSGAQPLREAHVQGQPCRRPGRESRYSVRSGNGQWRDQAVQLTDSCNPTGAPMPDRGKVDAVLVGSVDHRVHEIDQYTPPWESAIVSSTARTLTQGTVSAVAAVALPPLRVPGQGHGHHYKYGCGIAWREVPSGVWSAADEQGHRVEIEALRRIAMAAGPWLSGESQTESIGWPYIVV